MDTGALVDPVAGLFILPMIILAFAPFLLSGIVAIALIKRLKNWRAGMPTPLPIKGIALWCATAIISAAAWTMDFWYY